ncbi:MAG: hypothetical protein KJ015_32140 [Myxococcales bacterium]|nr:hypothetical protein [Myxococcales bacterium]
MRSTLRGVLALGTTLLLAGALGSGCGSDDSGGGSGGSTGGSGGSTGGSGGSTGGSGGSTGGSGGSTGGSGGSAGCPAAPDPNSTDACDVCQDQDHVECACDAEITACLADDECSAIWDCVVDGEPDAGVAACPTAFDATSADCVKQCIALHPNGKANYLAMEDCMYCNYCGAACDTAAYCATLKGAGDGGTTDGGSDASSDAPTGDAAGDAPTGDATGDSTTD